MSHFLVRDVSSFRFQNSKFSRLYHRKAPSKSSQGFTLCFQLLFSFHHPFITKVLHGGSTWWFVKDSFHSSIVLQDFSRSYGLLSYTLNKHGAQHMFCFEKFKYYSSFISKSNYFYLIFWCGVISFLTISIRVSGFTCCQEWGILKTIIFLFDHEVF